MNRVVFFLFSLITICSAEWPTYHGDASLRGLSSAELPDKLHHRWRYDGGGAVYGTPVSDGKRIFFSAKRGEVVALDLTGFKLWNISLTHTNNAGQEQPERIEAPLVCAKGVVVVGMVRGVVHALNMDTGSLKWSYDTAGTLVGSPNVMDDQVILLDQSEGALHALDIRSGKLLWKTEPIERCDGVPGIGKKHIVFGSCLAAFHVYSRDGKQRKDIDVGGDSQIAGGVAVLGTHAFGGTRDGSLLCVDLESGDLIWRSDESEEQTFSTPAVTVDRVIYASDDGFIYSVRRVDGSLLWKFDTQGMPYSPVVAGDKVVAVADGYLFLLSLEDGKELWSKEISDDITSPAMVGNRIVVGTDEGAVMAWGLPLTVRDNNVDE